MVRAPVLTALLSLSTRSTKKANSCMGRNVVATLVGFCCWFFWHQISIKIPRCFGPIDPLGEQIASANGSVVGRNSVCLDLPFRRGESASHHSSVDSMPDDCSFAMGGISDWTSFARASECDAPPATPLPLDSHGIK